MTVLQEDNPLSGFRQQAQVVAQVRPVGDDNPTPTAGQEAGQSPDRAAPPLSPLAAIRARVRAAREAVAYRDLRIPGLGNPTDKWDPQAVFVRYRMLTPEEVNTIIDRNRSVPGLDGWAFQWANSVQMLFAACLGMFSVDENGEPVGDSASWPRFGSDMAEDAGLRIDGAGDAAGALLREFYVAEADVVNAAEVVLTMSKRDNLIQDRALPEA